jgi:hypothetical protein
MNTLAKIGVASALAMGYVSAHAGAVVPTSSNPGDVFLFADVISGGSVIGAFAADTTVTVNGATGVTGSLTNGQSLYGSTTNLASLIALGSQAGNTIQWAVMGGGSQASGALQFVTTDTNSNLGTLTGRSGVNAGQWQSKFINTATLVATNTGANPDVFATSAGGAGGWDPTIFTTANASNWYSAGPTNLVNGLGTSASLYGVTADSSTSTNLVKASVLGNVTLTAAGLVFSTVTTAPVPLPAAIWLLGSGLLGLFGIGRRKAIAA